MANNMKEYGLLGIVALAGIVVAAYVILRDNLMNMGSTADVSGASLETVTGGTTAGTESGGGSGYHVFEGDAGTAVRGAGLPEADELNTPGLDDAVREFQAKQEAAWGVPTSGGL